jgi:hypothetical protein
MAYFKKILLVKAIGFGFRIVALEGYSVNNWVSNTKMCPTLFWTSLGNFLGWFFFFAPSFYLSVILTIYISFWVLFSCKSVFHDEFYLKFLSFDIRVSQHIEY